MKKIGTLLVCLILSLGIISPVKTEAQQISKSNTMMMAVIL